MAGKTYTWKSPIVLGYTVIAVVLLNLAIHCASIFVAAAYGASSAYTGDEQTLTGPQLLQGAVDLFTGLGLLACVVVPFWIVRVSKNAHIFKRDLQISPWGAVGWYVVPIMSLFKPYEAMSEIWQASEISVAARQDRIVIWWWVSFVLSGMLSTAVAIVDKTGSVPALHIADDLAGLVAGVIFVILVWRLIQMQIRKHGVSIQAVRGPIAEVFD